MAKEKDYKELFEKFVDYSQDLHQKNQRKIQVGLKVNVFVPMAFLVLSFAVSGAKLVFLVLWICTLFGIAFYLIYVEFSDYKMMTRLQKMQGEDAPDPGEISLIGETAEAAEAKVTEKLDYVDSKIDEEKRRLEEEKKRIEEEIAERSGRLKEIMQQTVSNKIGGNTQDKNSEETHEMETIEGNSAIEGRKTAPEDDTKEDEKNA